MADEQAGNTIDGASGSFDSDAENVWLPGVAVTDIDLDEALRILSDGGWDLANLYAMAGGHAEIYHRGEHVLEIGRTWTLDETKPPLLLSAVYLDDVGHDRRTDASLAECPVAGGTTIGAPPGDGELRQPATEEQWLSGERDLEAAQRGSLDSPLLDMQAEDPGVHEHLSGDGLGF